MRIVIATPLYPPDIAPLALYVKELAFRLKSHHSVTVVAYGSIPEVIEGVRIVTVPKHTPAMFRILRFSYVLWREARNADIVYVQNGASCELPTLLIRAIVHARVVLGLNDSVAWKFSCNRTFTRFALVLLMRVIHKTVCGIDRTGCTPAITTTCNNPLPASRPEILPFREYPVLAFDTYETSWDTHLKTLVSIFTYV